MNKNILINNDNKLNIIENKLQFLTNTINNFIKEKNNTSSQNIDTIKLSNWQLGAIPTKYAFYIDKSNGDKSTFYINDNKNIGIGTSVPNYKLHINGSFNVQDNLIVDNNIKLNSDVVITKTLIVRGSQTNQSQLSISGNITIDGLINNILNVYSVDNQSLITVYNSNNVYSSLIYDKLNKFTIKNTYGDLQLMTLDNNSGILLQQYSILLYNNTTFLSTLNVSGISQFNNILKVNNIQPLNDTLNIGQSLNSSIINLYGTSVTITTNQLLLTNKLLKLNQKHNSKICIGNDIGNLCGIEILSISNPGYIKTNIDGSRFLIKAPCEDDSKYIAVLDLYNNFYLSGTCTLFNKTTIGSNLCIQDSLLVSNNSILYGTTTIKTNLYVSNNTILRSLNVSNDSFLYGNITCNSNLYLAGSGIFGSLYVSGGSIFVNNTTLKSNLYISNNLTIGSSLNVLTSTLLGQTSIMGSLNISSHSVFIGSVTLASHFYVSGNAIIQELNISNNSIIYGHLNIGSNLYVSTDSILMGNLYISKMSVLNGDLTLGSNLYVSNTSIFNGDLTLGSNLYVSNTSILNSDLTVGSNLYVSNTSILNGDLTIGSNLYVSNASIIQNLTVTSILNTDIIIYRLLQTISDENYKTNICTTALGLDFINKLNPVDYKINNHNHHGFIAQDVKKLINEMNINFGGCIDVSDKNNQLSLGLLEFICPIVKAIQELSAKIDIINSTYKSIN